MWQACPAAYWLQMREASWTCRSHWSLRSNASCRQLYFSEWTVWWKGFDDETWWDDACPPQGCSLLLVLIWSFRHWETSRSIHWAIHIKRKYCMVLMSGDLESRGCDHKRIATTSGATTCGSNLKQDSAATQTMYDTPMPIPMPHFLIEVCICSSHPASCH